MPDAGSAAPPTGRDALKRAPAEAAVSAAETAPATGRPAGRQRAAGGAASGPIATAGGAAGAIARQDQAQPNEQHCARSGTRA